MSAELQFFIGKGGVGKSTTSALTALALAQRGVHTLLVSMDPAHNLSDIFQTDFSGRPRQMLSHLDVMEVDIEQWVKTCLKQTEAAIKQSYSYESAFNLEKHFDVLQYSPGAEEYALLLAFEDVLHASGDRQTIIFDMAPTALTLRFFSLPFITLIWLDSLLRLREEIYTKKEIISKITFGRAQIERDAVKTKLMDMIANYTHLKDHFVANGSRINLVINDDRLSFAEAFRIKTKLDQIGMRIERLIVNKTEKNSVPPEVRSVFRNQQFSLLPTAPKHLLGRAALEAFVETHQDQFQG
jgi:arsenite-transporting ATPase